MGMKDKHLQSICPLPISPSQPERAAFSADSMLPVHRSLDGHMDDLIKQYLYILDTYQNAQTRLYRNFSSVGLTLPLGKRLENMTISQLYSWHYTSWFSNFIFFTKIQRKYFHIRLYSCWGKIGFHVPSARKLRLFTTYAIWVRLLQFWYESKPKDVCQSQQYNMCTKFNVNPNASPQYVDTLLKPSDTHDYD